MLVYAATITPRLQYILDFFSSFYQYPFPVTDNKEQYLLVADKLNYSNERLSENEIWIKPVPVLFENHIQPLHLSCFEVKGYTVFFSTEGDHPFDIFAASFILLSRYEEYLPHDKDKHGRYAYQNSLAFRENFLHLPLVNIWLRDFEKVLASRFTSFSNNRELNTGAEMDFSFLPTYDIDIAWSYRHKGLLRNAGGMLRSMIHGRWAEVKQRINVLAGKETDPYDAYDWMDQLHRHYRLNPVYFFHVGRKTSRYDKNILPAKKAMAELIKRHSENFTVGIHPSWQSGDDPLKLKEEMHTLEHITGKKITASRQHFIRFNLPDTFRNLSEAGIETEFSMGYGSINGFRASVAIPFYWYDLKKEKQTKLMLYPFCFMDANSFFEQKFSPVAAFDELMHYYTILHAVGGNMITIWHNTILGSNKNFEGWKEVYEKFISVVSSSRPAS